MSYLLANRNPNGDSFYPSRRSPLDLIVVHITAGLEDLSGADSSAERTAAYAASTDRAVSWHAGADSDSWLELLPASYTAFHVKGFNSRAYGLEISKANTRWTGMPADWVERTLRNAAAALAPVVTAYRIPLVLLTRAQAAAGGRGFASHASLDPTRRSDPGSDFPWTRLFALIRELIDTGEDLTVMDPVTKKYLDEAFARVGGGPRVRDKQGKVIDKDQFVSLADVYTLIEESEARNRASLAASEARILAAVQAARA